MKVIGKDGSVTEAKFEEELGREAFRHTCAHVLAQAVKRLYPNAKCAIGPAIENGFYYDFDFGFNFSEKDMQAVEKEMKKIVNESLQLQRFTCDRQEACRLMEERNEPYKVEPDQRSARGCCDQLLQTGRISGPVCRTASAEC